MFGWQLSRDCPSGTYAPGAVGYAHHQWAPNNVPPKNPEKPRYVAFSKVKPGVAHAWSQQAAHATVQSCCTHPSCMSMMSSNRPITSGGGCSSEISTVLCSALTDCFRNDTMLYSVAESKPATPQSPTSRYASTSSDRHHISASLADQCIMAGGSHSQCSHALQYNCRDSNSTTVTLRRSAP